MPAVCTLGGDVEAAAAQVVAVARSELAVGGPRCVILAGETTVQFGGAVAAGTVGKGGRCSHMALLVAQALSGVPNWCAPFGSEPACEAADTRTHTHTHTHTHVCTVSSLACASLEKLCAQSADRGSLSYVLP
jgi:glycerate-2-kinase